MSNTLEAARAELLVFLNVAAGTHAFAVTGLSMVLRSVLENVTPTQERPDPRVYWGPGDPNIPGNITAYPGWLRSEFVRNIQPGGVSNQFQAWAWIALVYDRWEDDFRHRFAKAMGCSQQQVRCDVMGELRYLRHDVTHKRGLASADYSGKCEILRDWVRVGHPIIIGVEHASEFYALVANDEGSIYQAS